MTKTNTRSTSHKPQHNGSPRKTQLIKFRVTPQEKRELEIMCEILPCQHLHSYPPFPAQSVH